MVKLWQWKILSEHCLQSLWHKPRWKSGAPTPIFTIPVVASQKLGWGGAERPNRCLGVYVTRVIMPWSPVWNAAYYIQSCTPNITMFRSLWSVEHYSINPFGWLTYIVNISWKYSWFFLTVGIMESNQNDLLYFFGPDGDNSANWFLMLWAHNLFGIQLINSTVWLAFSSTVWLISWACQWKHIWH